MRRLRTRGRHSAAAVVALAAAEVAAICGALAEAAAYRRARAAQWCELCQTAPSGACPGHVTDLEQANAYDVLGTELAEITGGPKT